MSDTQPARFVTSEAEGRARRTSEQHRVTRRPGFAALAAGEHKDRSLPMARPEVRRAARDAPLGHVSPDGPAPGRSSRANGTARPLARDAG